MSDTRDGGIAALAGYLYQIVGLLGMQAWDHSTTSASDPDELETLLLLVKSGQLYHEDLDQDAVIRQLGVETDDRYTLVQFKFSNQPQRRAISPGGMLDIVKGLHNGTKRASQLGQNVTGYALVTNRRLGEGAKDLLTAAQMETPHCHLRLTYRRHILRQLLTVTELPLSDWDHALRCFARKFGADEQEIGDGIDRLIGSLLRRTTQGGRAPVSMFHLVEAFAGSRKAHPLTPELVVRHSDRRVVDSAMNPCVAVVRRKLLNEIAETASMRALVVLHGLGGCGKTVALWQWAQELTRSSPPGGGAFTAVSLASEIPRLWIAKEICDWANLAQDSSRRTEQHKRALDRLDMANPGLLRPIMHLGLDGLDEKIGTADREDRAKEILRWFWEEDQLSQREVRPPRATLVVTCRNAEDVTERWLRLSVSGFEHSGEMPQGVEVSAFSSDELEEVAQQTAPRGIRDRIIAALQPPTSDRMGGRATYHERLLPLGASASAGLPVDEQVLEALKHPTMWRALLGSDTSVQSRILDGEPGALRELAGVFVRRFCRKLLDRGRVCGLSQAELLDVLHAVALHSQPTGQALHSVDDWVDPACHTRLVNLFQAKALYREARSGGIVVLDDPRHWRWWHSFVEDYLAATQ